MQPQQWGCIGMHFRIKQEEIMVDIGKNVSVETKGDKLVITVDVSKKTIDAAPKSSTGKSSVVATTSGFVKLNGSGLQVGLNVISK